MGIPGRTRMRGMFLFEMQGTIAYLAKHSFDIGEIGKDEYLKRLRTASIFLEEAIEILAYEPENTIEGLKLKTARKFRTYLGEIVSGLLEHEKQTIHKSSNGMATRVQC